VKIVDHRNKKKYELHLGQSYPFFAPQKIIVNGELYRQKIKLTCPRFRNPLRYLSRHIDYAWYSNQHHFSIISPRNWSPIYRIIRILGEIDDVSELKKTVAMMVLLDTIKQKYRIPEEIPIIEYLI
jgi:uncharacterized protein YbaR (Trm112 family)